MAKKAKQRNLRAVKKFSAAKKGSEAIEGQGNTIAWLIPAAVNIFIFVTIIVAVWAITKKTAYADQGTDESFKQLVAKAKELDEGRLTEGIGHAYFISDKMSLYGFNAISEELQYKDGEVRKPVTAADLSLGKCKVGEACLCLCDKRDCTGFVMCNPKDVAGKTVNKPFTSIQYFVVKADADPKNKFNKGLPITGGDPAISGNFFAIFGDGDNWRQGKVIFLKRNGNTVEVSFPLT